MLHWFNHSNLEPSDVECQARSNQPESNALISFELTEEAETRTEHGVGAGASEASPAARTGDDRESIPPAILGEIWATGIIQSQAGNSGAESSPIMKALLLEELATGEAAFAMAAAAPMGFVSASAMQGSAEQRRKLLPLFTGDKYRCAAIAIMEPDFAFDVTALRTTAVNIGSGYRLTGAKGLVPLASQCSHFLVVAGCDDGREAFIVDRHARGVEVSAPKPNIGGARSRWQFPF